MHKSKELHKEISDQLKTLHLPAIRTMFPDYSRHAEKEELGYEEYLHDLLEEELISRDNRRTARFQRESRLPLEKTLDTFDTHRLSPKTSAQVKELLKGDFLKHHENVLAFGNPGSGKTHLLCAIGLKLIRQGKRVYFATCGFLIQELLLAKQVLKLNRKMKQLARFDVVILDDIGYIQQKREEMEVLFSFFSEKYERGSVMLSSNLPFSRWEEIFKDPMLAAAAIDRLVHHSIILDMNLPSYRMENARTKNKGGDL